jgi:subfamily B ATP-binding cassette protein MsbA
MNLSMQKILAAGDRVFEVMDEPRESVGVTATHNSPGAAPQLSGDIRFEDVSFGYEPDSRVLKKFSLHIQPGELVAIVGPSGSGKTTIVNLLLRFYEPVSGRILVDGVPINDIHLQDLRRQIAVVPQETFLFSGSSRENIAYARPGVADAVIVEAAKAAYAHDFLVGSVDGYLTQIGERGVQLSGGQRQRLAIARAIVRNPRIIVFDEATSHLDSESEHIIQAALERMAGGRTILVIAHRFSTIRRADKIVVVENGKVVETGSHEELLELNGRYRKVHSLQTQLPGAAV